MWRRVKISCTTVCFLITLQFSLNVVTASSKEKYIEYLLCRFCGADTADSNYLNHLVSPTAILYKNQSLYGLDEVGVQLLENPSGNRFHLVTLTKAGCVGEGSWVKKDTWFPGYSWRNCYCSHCGRQLGWMFRPDLEVAEENKKPSTAFYALIVDNLLSESYSDSLIMFPKL